MKIRVGILIAAVAVLALTACGGDPQAIIQIANHTDAEVTATVTVEGLPPVEADFSGHFGTETEIAHLVTFGKGDLRVSVDVTIDNAYRSPMSLQFTLVPYQVETIAVIANRGIIHMLTYNEEDLMAIWVLPAVGTSYNTALELDGAAVDKLGDFAPGTEDVSVKVLEGTYYLVYQNADGYYYNDPGLDVVIGEGTQIGLGLDEFTAHPTL